MDGSGRRNRSGETWAAARAAYLDGLSAGEVCAHFDLGLSALRARARREGWRRIDQADLDPDLQDDLDEELDAQVVDFEAMTERALRMSARALDLADGASADRWLRLHLRLKAAGAQRRSEEGWRSAAAKCAAAAAAAADVHSVHSVHPDSECISTAALEPTPSRVLNRADRRRLERLAAHQARTTTRGASAEGP